MFFRIAAAGLLAATTVGCGQYGVSGPDDLGLIQHLNPATLPVSLDVQAPSAEVQRNQVLSKWIARSDYLCNNYQLRISRSIRDARLGTDAVATVLSGLATILAPVQTKTALAGAATMTLGIGSDFQSDLFAQQAGEVVTAAIHSVRSRARDALQAKMQAPYVSYTLEQGLVDVQRYDQETCNLNVGLNELRASLITGPAKERPNDPILPLPPTALVPPLPPVLAPPPPNISLQREIPKAEPRPRQTRERVEPSRFTQTPVGQNYARFIEGPVMFLNEKDLNGVFAALCVSQEEINDVDPAPTTARIRAFQDWNRRVARDPIPSATGRLTPDEIVKLAGMPSCNKKRYENIYEVNFRPGKDINSPILIDKMLKVVPLEAGKKSPTSTSELRERIPAVRAALAGKLVLNDSSLSNQLTNDLVNVLFGVPNDIPAAGSPN